MPSSGDEGWLLLQVVQVVHEAGACSICLSFTEHTFGRVQGNSDRDSSPLTTAAWQSQATAAGRPPSAGSCCGAPLAWPSSTGGKD